MQAKMWHEASCYGSDACWVETYTDGTAYEFDANTSASVYGELVFEVDKDGNTVTLTYPSGTAYPAQLSTVTAASGDRSLSFTWTGSNITEIEDSLSRTATFAYTSGGELSDVTLAAPNDPVSHHWHFTYYGSSPYRMYRWWSPNDEAAYPGTNAYATTIAYSSGIITSVTQPEMTTECNGTSGTPLCSPETTFTYPSWDSSTDTGTVDISDPNENAGLSDGRLTLDTYVDGLLTSQVQGYGTGEDATAMTVSIRDPYTLLPLETMDADGYLTVTNRDSLGQVLQVTDPLGRTTSYLYDDDGGVAEQTDAMGNVTVTAYNSAGDKTSSTDPLGNVTSWTYGSGAPPGLPHTMTNALTGVTTYGYDAEGDLTSTTDPDGDVTTSLYDAVGELCASLSADGYAASDRLGSSCSTSAAAYETVYPAYDVFGNDLEKITPTNAAGGTWQFGYDADGEEASVENPDSETTTTIYDADDNKLSVAVPAVSGASPTTTYAYDADGNQVATTEPLGNASGCGCAAAHTTALSYDDLGRQLSSTDPLGNVTTYTYDADGNQLSVTPPAVTHSQQTTYSYDADDEMLTSEDNLGDESTYGYNADGERDCAGDQNAEANGYTCPADPTAPVTDTITTTYNADGNAASSTDPLGNLTTYFYDADNNEVAYTNPDGNSGGMPSSCNPLTTSHCAYTYYDVYDDANRMTSSTTPPTATSSTGESTSYSYDADGNQKTVTDPLGQVTTDSYDGLDELTGVAYTSTVNSTPNVTYSYTNEGKTYEMTDGAGTTTYTYDADGRTTGIENGAGAVLKYTYDLDSNLTCIAYPGSSNSCSNAPGSGNDVVDYTYDHDDRMSTVTDWDGDTLTYTYNHDGVPQELSANSGAVTENIDYDAAGNVTSIDTTAGSSTLLELAYTYDNDGNTTQETPTISSGTQPIEQFSVNAGDEPNDFKISSTSYPTTYDAASEIEQNSDVTSDQSAGYDQATDLCWTDSSTVSGPSCSAPPTGSTSFTYDADGERTKTVPSSSNSQAYAWNADNELRCVNTNGTTCSISSPTSTTTEYAYDGNGLRASSTINSTTTAYTWDTPAGARLAVAGSTAYIYGVDMAPVVQISGTTSDMLLTDPRGAAHGLVQLSGGSLADDLVNYTDYDADGNPTDTGGLTQGHPSINSNWVGTSTVGYGGSLVDSTGLDYTQQSYYDPATGQSLSPRPTAASGPLMVKCPQPTYQMYPGATSVTCAAYIQVLSDANSGLDGVVESTPALTQMKGDLESEISNTFLDSWMAVMITGKEDKNWNPTLCGGEQECTDSTTDATTSPAVYGLGQVYGVNRDCIDVGGDPADGDGCKNSSPVVVNGEKVPPGTDNPYIQIWMMHVLINDWFLDTGYNPKYATLTDYCMRAREAYAQEFAPGSTGYPNSSYIPVASC